MFFMIIKTLDRKVHEKKEQTMITMLDFGVRSCGTDPLNNILLLFRFQPYTLLKKLR